MIRFYKKSIRLMLAVLLCLPLAACSREEKTGELNPPPLRHPGGHNHTRAERHTAGRSFPNSCANPAVRVYHRLWWK